MFRTPARLALRAGLLVLALFGLEIFSPAGTPGVGLRTAEAQFFFGWGERRYRDPAPRPPQPIGRYHPRQNFGFPGFFGDPWQRRRRVEPRTRREPSRSETRAPPAHRAPSHRAPETEPAKRVIVFGDSLADWLGYGLEEAFAEGGEIGVTRKHRAWAGLIKNEPRDYDWVEHAREALAAEKADIVVMMVGVGDRHAIRESVAAPPAEVNEPARKRRPTVTSHEFRSERWVALYTKRVDEVIAVLKSKGVPVLWVGLPPVRGPRSRSDLTFLNDIFKERAEKAGIAYVDVWDGFLDEEGDFSQFGPDVMGQVRRLRTSDGVHFTRPGARKLAHFVEREIRRLLTHDIPVALPGPADAQPEGAPPPTGPAPRPVAGPVVPLTGGAPTEAALLGGRAQDMQVADPVAAKVLVKGEPPAPLDGRADNFVWPRPHGVADNDVAEPPTLPPPAVAQPQQQPQALRGLPQVNQGTRSAGRPSRPVQ